MLGSALLLGIVACSGQAEGGAESPQAVFDRAQKAGEKKDWNAYFDAWDPENNHVVLLTAYFAAFASGDGSPDTEKDLATLMKKHGADESQNDPDVGEAFRKSVKPVKDKRKLFKDLISYADVRMLKKNKPLRMLEGKLQDVVVTDDKATGAIVKPDGKKGKVNFSRRGGKWYLFSRQGGSP
jgi:hypothetical protein